MRITGVLKTLRDACPGPVVIKGVLTGDDAKRAIAKVRRPLSYPITEMARKERQDRDQRAISECL
jgi:hypothetical protein